MILRNYTFYFNKLIIFIAFNIAILPEVISQTNHTVKLNSDGTFSPKILYIDSKDTVQWDFNHRTDVIVPIDSPSTTNYHTHYRSFDPNDVNEFTGPLPRAVSGLFSIGPDGRGYKIYEDGPPEIPCVNTFKDSLNYLCDSGQTYASMDWTWQQKGITGVFIKLRWNEVHLAPGIFKWDDLDREIQKAVDNGKMYSLSFKAGLNGTPNWIFNPDVVGDSAVKELKFNLDPLGPDTSCGAIPRLGSPADSNYRMFYFNVWKAAADHIKEKNAWYRALAYLKPSGMNVTSHENKLPKDCDTTNTCICNDQVWAENGNYTPDALYGFYEEQFDVLSEAFPNKDLSYMLIQAGFPKINNNGTWATWMIDTLPLPGGTDQTDSILTRVFAKHGESAVVQHNGLGRRAEDADGGLYTCKDDGARCPNDFVRNAWNKNKQVTGFQTVNRSSIKDPIAMESALRNAWENSGAIFIEIFEEGLWEAETYSPILDSNGLGITISQWTDSLHKRRIDSFPHLPNPFPLSHQHVFQRTSEDPRKEQRFYYTNSSSVSTTDSFDYGVIVIVPNENTSIMKLSSSVLHQPYPNPFHESITVPYQVQTEGNIDISIYNTHGKLVQHVLNNHHKKGLFEFQWKTRTKGLYLCVLNSDQGQSYRKIISQ